MRAPHRLQVSLTIETGAAAPRSAFASWAGLGAAALMAVASLVGILSPATYARETPAWTGQALGQDWADLVLGVPALVIAGLGARRGSRTAALVLAGAFVYTIYTFVLYAFAVHFNQVFLVYCAVLGLAFFGLASQVGEFARVDARTWYRAGAPRRAAGGLLIGVAVMFALLWLSEIIPALVANRTPATITEVGLLTNPVHVIDLSVILPALLIAGLGLYRGTMPGLVLGPVLLVFSTLMAASIAGMMFVMRAYGYAASMAVAAAMVALAIVTAAMTIWLLRHVEPTA